MKVLFLHPEDSLTAGAWSQSRWDLIVDLGFASSGAYRQWSAALGTRVLSIHDFAGQSDGYRWVNQVFEHGRGRLLDRTGLDWWEILAVSSHHEILALYLARQLRPEIGETSELSASRPHPFTRVLEQVLRRSIHYFEIEKRGPLRRAAHMVRSARRLRPAQMAEIALDKWDSDYQARRHLNRYKRARLSESVVLLPSAYSNVTRAALAYAAQLPRRRFLLMTTRNSAIPALLPENVTLAPLAAYAMPPSTTEMETAELTKEWQKFLQATTREVEEFRQATAAGFWDYFPAQLESGLRLRDAWKNTLAAEPIHGVLCGDDLNHYTRLPLILACRAGLTAVYCSHGALDGGFLFKVPYADAFLLKGEMESDYLQRVANIDPEKIFVAAPGALPVPQPRASQARSGAIVFFSQPYEVEDGRADEIYRELLPRLQAVAHQTGRKLIVKLHPFESLQSRKALVASILSPDALHHVEVISRVPVEKVMDQAWCGIAIDSSVAVECSLKGIPFFLCGWLDFMGLGYLRQFARYGAGRILENPDDIRQIPAMVAGHNTDPAALRRLWHEPDPARLEQILFAAKRGGRASRLPQPRLLRSLKNGFDVASPGAAGLEKELSHWGDNIELSAPLQVLTEDGQTRLNEKSMWPNPTQLMHRMVYPALASVGYFQSRVTADVNVVTYHGVLPAGYDSTDDFLDGALIAADAFRDQLLLLKKRYNVVAPEQLLGWLRQQQSLPERAIVLTCDDGLLNHFTGVLPILQELGLKCIFFVTGASLAERPEMQWYTELYLMLRDMPCRAEPTAVRAAILPRITDSLKERRSLWVTLMKSLSRMEAAERRGFMDELTAKVDLAPDWKDSYLLDPVLRERFLAMGLPELKKLTEAGMTIGAHTLTHPSLSEQSPELAREEISRCRETLENRLGHPVWAFAYPFGDPASVGAREYRMAEEAGYECAFINVGGSPSVSSARFAFPRVHVTSGMSLTSYEAHVSGVHDAIRTKLRRSRKVM